MNKKETTKKGLNAKTAIGLGVTVAALGAAAYVLFGPDAKKNRKAIRGWAVKMKGEIIEKFEEAKEISEPTYHKIIDTVSAKYSKVKNIDPKELELVVSDIKKHWKTMMKEAENKSTKKKTTKK